MASPHLPADESGHPAPAPALVAGTFQASRGDGSAALLVMRLPREAMAALGKDEFWNKFLKALQLDWPVVRVVNVLTPEPLPLAAVLALVPARRVLLFGDALLAPLPPDLPRYAPHTLPSGHTLVLAHAADALDNSAKRALWEALRPLFGV